jgi:hypothetical protein
LIRYRPDRLLARVAPERLLKKLVSRRLTLKRATLLSLSDAREILGIKKLERIALSVIKQYREKYGELLEEDFSATEAKDEAVNDAGLLVQRVQDSVVLEVSKEIKEKYRGEIYEWLPSDAEEPDPEHQLKYGKRFRVGEGEMPGERFGCRCGMNILVDETELDLSE